MSLGGIVLQLAEQPCLQADFCCAVNIERRCQRIDATEVLRLVQHNIWVFAKLCHGGYAMFVIQAHGNVGQEPVHGQILDQVFDGDQPRELC